MAPLTSGQLENQFQEVRGGRESIGTIRERREQELGASDTRNRINNLNKILVGANRTLEELPQDVETRGRRLGGPVTSASRNRLTSALSQPILKNISNTSIGINTENNALENVLRDIGIEINDETSQRKDTDFDFIRRINDLKRNELAQMQIDANNAAEERRMRFANSQNSINGISDLINSILGDSNAILNRSRQSGVSAANTGARSAVAALQSPRPQSSLIGQVSRIPFVRNALMKKINNR